MRFAFIQQQGRQGRPWPVSTLCRILSVTVQGYAAWQKRQHQSSVRQQADARLLLQIKAAHRQGRMLYGSPRVHHVLRDQGVHSSRKRVARLMSEAGLCGVCRGRNKPRTTQSNHQLPVAENLLERQFAPEAIGGIDRALCGDITYIPTAQGWLYLATVEDLFSRRIIGWQMSHSLEAGLVCDAFKRAMGTRAMGTYGTGAIGRHKLFHSDRGSQYASGVFEEILNEHGFVASMSRKGNCWDNAVAESFFGTYKSELVALQPGGRFADRDQAYQLTADYIENFYNRVRLHSTLGYRSPVAFELTHQIGHLSSI